MDIAVVKELIGAFKEAELTSLSLKCEEFELELGHEVKETIVQPVQKFVAQEVEDKPLKVKDEVNEAQQEDAYTGKKIISSPMVGTFYAASNPKGAPLVEVGSKVKVGDVVCIVEAMKLMNEVEADVEGEVVEILVKNEEMVEYNQPLFILK